MSEVIDTSVVKIRFDNQEFINNVNMSIMAVDALKDSLVFDSNSFDALSKAANNIDLSAISENVESLSQRFSTFGIVGMTAIQRITNAAIDLAGKLGNLLAAPWKQIVSGGWSRASNISQAKFQLEGLFGKSEEGAAKLNMTMAATSEQVAALAMQSQQLSEDMIVAMNAADYAVADTAYGLDSAAKAASVLATSGVDVLHFTEDLKDESGKMRTEMQVALRGISGVAAMANRGYDDVARVFERVSGAGRVMGDDLNSLASYGLNAAATIRDYLNEMGDAANYTEQDIRDMVSHGKIDFMTFAKAMDDAYGEHAKDANNTFSGAFGNMKFALSKIGADFITPIRTNMVPLFNDLRIAINQVRKALNFKMKFEGIEEEISLVELFTRVIGNLTNKIHGFFDLWHGGQNVMEQAMAGFVNETGLEFENVKKIFDSVTAGTQNANGAINELTALAASRGRNLDDVYSDLAKTFDKTETEIREMCRNGEISFEDFYAAMSNVFGGKIADTRISQFANIINNLVGSLINVAKIITGVVGPVILGFFQAFNLGGMNGIISITGAIRDFTKSLIASRDVQNKIRLLAYNIFTIIRSGLKVVFKLASAAFKVAKELAPLIVYVIDFANVIASVISYIVDIIVESNILSSTISIIGQVFQVVGYVIINVIRIILSLIGPAIRGIGEVFAFLARSIGSIDFSFLGVILDQLRNFVDAVVNGGIINGLQVVVNNFFGTLGNLFKGMTLSFEIISKTLENVASRIATICQRIIDIVKGLKAPIVETFTQLFTKLREIISDPRKLIAMIGQLTSLTLLARFAQTMRGIGRTFSGLGNYLNSNAILAFVNSIKTLARAILEFAVAIVLISSIPTENLQTTLALMTRMFLIIEGFLITYFAYMLIITRINSKVQADPMVKFMNKLNSSINAFLGSLGRAATIVALGIALVSLAASLGFFFKAIKQFSDTSEETGLSEEAFKRGITRIVQIVTLITASLGIIALATRASMTVLGGNIIDSSLRGGSGGLMGAAVAMLALVIVIRAFEEVIKEYAAIKYTDEHWEKTFWHIGISVAIITGGIALIGLTAKRAGFGLMSSVSAMMGLMTALEAFEEIIKKYYTLIYESDYDPEKLRNVFIVLGVMVAVLIGGLSTLAFVLSRGTSSFSASIKNGVSFTSNAARFLGVVVMLMGICVAFQAFALAVNSMDPANIANAGSLIGMLAVVFAGMAVLVGLSRSVPVGNTIGLTVMLVALSTILPLLSAYDWKDLIAGALSMSVLIGVLGFMVKSLGSFTNGYGGLAGIIFMSVVLYEMLGVIEVLSGLNTSAALNGALGMAAIIAAFSLIFLTVGKVPGNLATIGRAFVQMSLMMIAVLGVVSILSLLSNIPINPMNLAVITAAVIALGLGISAMMAVLNFTTIRVATGMFTELIGIGIMLSMLAGALVLATNVFTGKASNLKKLAIAINYLIPIIVVIGAMSAAMSSLAVTTKGVGLMAGIVGIVSALVFLFAMIAKIGDPSDTISLMKGFADTVIQLSIFLGVLFTLGAVIGAIATTGVGIVVLVGGLLGIVALLGVISGFVASIAAIGKIGDASDTVMILDNLGTSLDAMVPFLLKMAAMCVVAGLLSPIIIAGASGFGSILKMISKFTLMMAIIANIGSVSNTISVMSSVTEALNELVGTFKVLVILGLLAAPVVTGMALLITAVGLLLTVSLAIGAIDRVRESILSGIETILITSTSLVAATQAMNLIDISAILHFVEALSVLAFAPVIGIAKFGLIATLMTAIGVSSSNVLKGSTTAYQMIFALSNIATLAKNILKIDTSKLVNMSTDIFKTAYNLAQLTGMYHVAGMIEGLLDPDMLTKLATAAAICAWVVAASMRKTLGIHSPGDEGEEEMNMHILGQIQSLTDSNNLNNLIGAGSNMMGSFGSSMTNLASTYGNQVGGSFIVSMEDTLINGIKNSGINDLYQYFANGVITEHVAYRTGMTAPTADTSNTVTTTVDIKYRGNFQSYEEFLAWEKEHPNGDEDINLDVNADMPFDFTDFSWLYEDLGDVFNLGSITDSLGDVNGLINDIDASSGSASSSVDKLTKSIEDLMSKYEDLWENAKENANKDLFKGVDDQGDDFLDSIQDIMDQYENIYKSAVERTNGQDLFAEVKDDEESFAPETLLRNLEDQVNQINELNTITASLSTRITDENLRAAISNMDVNDLPQLRALYRMNDSQLREYQQMYQNKVQANQNKIQNELSGSLSQITGQYTNVAEFIATDASTDQLVANLQAQIDQLNEYNNTVASLMNRITDMDLRAAIAEMGVDALPELKHLNAMSDAMLTQYQDMYHQKIAAEATSLRNELSAQLSEVMGMPLDIEPFYDAYTKGMIDLEKFVKGDPNTIKVGSTAGTTVANNMNSESSKSAATTSGAALTNSLADGVADEDATERAVSNAKMVVEKILAVFDESRDRFKDAGADLINRLCAGMDALRRSDQIFAATVYSVINDINDKMSTKLFLFERLGENIVYGIQRGINNKLPIAEAAATNLAMKTYSAAAKAFESHSPSKKFIELGKFLDQGLAIGMKDYSYLATDEVSGMAEGTVSAMQSAIQQLSGMLDGTIDVNPVITPTLDLSEVNARSAALSNMFNARQIAVQARNDDMQVEMMTKLGNVLAEQNTKPASVTFEQNNYSPKALSRKEIYRDTRSMFSQIANAIS